MTGSPIVIGGIPLPSDAPLFLTFVALHVVAGLACVIAGAVAMLSQKQPGRHPRLVPSTTGRSLVCSTP
jgi:hypothetical protein